jgi:hypothetical protein
MTLRIAGGDVRRGVPGGGDPYVSRLVKLVPAEAVTVCPVMLQQAQTVTPIDGSRWAVYITAWAMLLIVIVLRWAATREPGKGAQWGAILIAAVSFFIWVHVLGGDFGFERLIANLAPGGSSDSLTRNALGNVPNTEELRKFASNLSLTAWTLLAPAVYRGDEG